MGRQPLIAGNWKMFKNREEARALCSQLVDLVGGYEEATVVVCPPFTALSTAFDVLEGSRIRLGAQNVHWENEGAYTGEVSTQMLLDCGCRYVIVGHSERRQLFGETDRTVQLKVRKALEVDLTPIVCVGETLREREGGRAREVVLSQLEKGLAGLTSADLSRIIVAYEPVWAIGTGRTATPEIAQEVHYTIRSWFGTISPELPGRIRVLYGGSVKPGNVAVLMAQDDIDGGLIGGASLKAETFGKIVTFEHKGRSAGTPNDA
ncbi:MAG: triose-phosphate isomerase [Acidobacteriota bacterium]